MTRIVEATSEQQIAQVAGLLADFLAWQETRYGAGTQVIEAYFDRAAWDAELSELGRVYGPSAQPKKGTGYFIGKVACPLFWLR